MANLFQGCLVPKKPGGFVEPLTEIIEKNYNVLGNQASGGHLDLEETPWLRGKGSFTRYVTPLTGREYTLICYAVV